MAEITCDDGYVSNSGSAYTCVAVNASVGEWQGTESCQGNRQKTRERLEWLCLWMTVSSISVLRNSEGMFTVDLQKESNYFPLT